MPSSPPRVSDWPSVSVIVPVYNDIARLELCLERLRLQSYPSKFEIVVIDNCSTDIPEEFARANPDIVFAVQPNIGSYSARNFGVQLSASEIVAFTDADCLPDSDWLQNGVCELLRARADIVCGRIEMFLTGKNAGAAELYNFATAFPQELCVRVRHFGATANLMTRRAMFETVGTFNTTLRAGGDKDWCRRAHSQGRRLVYCAAMVVRHPARNSEEAVLSQLRRGIGGARDRAPGWSGCAATAVKHVIGIAADLYAIHGHRGRSLRLRQRLLASLYAFRYRFAAIRERFRLQASKQPTPRS